MKLIPYWIQRADFSATDYSPVDVAGGVHAFEGHDWRRELDHYSELEGSGVECCPPGIGFVDADGDILHICPTESGRVMVHYHFTSTRRLLGLIPMPRSIVEARQDMTRSEVLELIGFFFEGRHDWMLQTLGRRPNSGMQPTACGRG